MRKWRRQLLLQVILLPVLAAMAGAGASSPATNGNGERDMLLYVDRAASPWHDANLEQQIIRTFTRRENVRIAPVADRADRGVSFPAAVFDLDSLTNWGLEVGGRYLVLVLVDDERLETKKTFHLPLIFHKYQTVGILEGELRVVDVSRRRLLLAEPFRVEKAGPRAFQATMDDDVNDPDLHVSASAKRTFFQELESAFADRLVKRVGSVIRIR
ncbi:MAG: hypothetical protein KKB37_05240 [Alphaproteobacteria bacterium]|nr:hypothetical protein [Alphaproteobacteria bacterium]